MADQSKMTEAEVQAAFREGERFAKLFEAFRAVRDVALRHIQMNREIAAMENEKAALQTSIAKTKQDLEKIVNDRNSESLKLQLDNQRRSKDLEKAHLERVNELGEEIEKLNKRRAEAENRTGGAEGEARERLADLQKAILDAETKAAEAIERLDRAVAAKQAEFDKLKKSFDAFVQSHNLR